MAESPNIGITAAEYEQLAADYAASWGISCYAVDREGYIVYGTPPCVNGDCERCRGARLFAINEGMRWGEAAVSLCPQNHLVWGVPLMHNQNVVGGIVATIREQQLFPEGQTTPALDIRSVCHDLRLRLEQANHTNAAALAQRRRQSADEQQRAYAIHSFKKRRLDSMRELYLHEEPALLSAIRAADRAEAHEILDRIIIMIHHHAGMNLDMVKSYFMELCVSMCRTAVDGGGAPEDSLGVNHIALENLAHLDGESYLGPWLKEVLDQLIEAVERNRSRDSGSLLHRATDYMRRHVAEDLSRDHVAKVCGSSPSHFSLLIRRESGLTFTELLSRMRVEKAAELLVGSRKPLAQVAYEAGFRDQSYFTKVFKRYRKRTPRQYRLDFERVAQQ